MERLKSKKCQLKNLFEVEKLKMKNSRPTLDVSKAKKRYMVSNLFYCF